MSEINLKLYQSVTIPTKNNQEGAIFGIDEASKNCSVYIFSEQEVSIFNRRDLIPNDKMYSKDDFYDGTEITVSVDDKGRGYLKNA